MIQQDLNIWKHKIRLNYTVGAPVLVVLGCPLKNPYEEGLNRLL